MAIANRETPFPLTARTATPTAVDLSTKGAAGCIIYIDVTADPSSASVTFNFDGYDVLGDETWTLLDSAAVVGVGFTVYRIWPGATVTANVGANEWLPDTLRIAPIHVDSDSITYSVTVVWLR